MPNSDTADGVHNKITKEIRQYETLMHEDSTSEIVCPQSFGGNVETAKAYFFHADALTNNDTNGTQIEYAITGEGNGFKFTIAFGTKGAGTAEADDWADTWKTTKDTLVSADKWVNKIAEENFREQTANGLAGSVGFMGWKSVDATPHLF